MARKNKNAGERRKRRPPKGQKRERPVKPKLPHILDAVERNYIGGTHETETRREA